MVMQQRGWQPMNSSTQRKKINDGLRLYVQRAVAAHDIFDSSVGVYFNSVWNVFRGVQKNTEQKAKYEANRVLRQLRRILGV